MKIWRTATKGNIILSIDNVKAKDIESVSKLLNKKTKAKRPS
jgi:hypothetical protein